MSQYYPGTHVHIDGLKLSPLLNGQIGIVCSGSAGERIPVIVGKKRYLIQEKNLEPTILDTVFAKVRDDFVQKAVWGDLPEVAGIYFLPFLSMAAALARGPALIQWIPADMLGDIPNFNVASVQRIVRGYDTKRVFLIFMIVGMEADERISKSNKRLMRLMRKGKQDRRPVEQGEDGLWRLWQMPCHLHTPGVRADIDLPREQLVAVMQRRFCSVCGAGGVSRCARCESVYYCGEVCQRRSWKVHKAECCRLKQLRTAAHEVFRETGGEVNGALKNKC